MKLKITLAALILLIIGCAGPKETRYYLLEYVPTISAERLQQGPWPWRVRIKELTIAEAYRRNEIVYRQSPHEMRFYNYELWAVKPEYLVTDMLYRHLRDAKLFRELTRSIETEEADYVLKGEINALEEYDNEDLWFAHLALSLYLEDSRTNKIVWMRNWDYRKKVLQQEPVFVVRELSELLEKTVNEASLSLDSMFRQPAMRDTVAVKKFELDAPIAPPPPDEAR